MSKTASQKLLRDLNQRIGQLENEKSLMAKYMGRLEQQLAELREAALSVVEKESVARQSKAISAVNVPPELGRAIDTLAALLPEEGK